MMPCWKSICSEELRIMLKNKLNMISQVELSKEEERLSKMKAKWLFESNTIDGLESVHLKD